MEPRPLSQDLLQVPCDAGAGLTGLRVRPSLAAEAAGVIDPLLNQARGLYDMMQDLFCT